VSFDGCVFNSPYSLILPSLHPSLLSTPQEVIDLFVKMGFRSKRMDADIINAVATLYFDRDDSTVIGKGMNLQVKIRKGGREGEEGEKGGREGRNLID